MKSFSVNGTAIMGILNITPDSFYDGGRYQTKDEISDQIEKLISEKVDIIDVGAESSRPGSLPVSESEELNRIALAIPFIGKYKNITFSIDTWKPKVAEYALTHGFGMINDICGGGKTGEMFEISAKYDVPVVIMHMLGRPETMQQNPDYRDLNDELFQFFNSSIQVAKSRGVSDRNIILDPGIGFGKRLRDNFEIINSIPLFKSIGYPVLIGASRKSFLSIDNDEPEDRLGASITAAVFAVMNGADIIRVHDVAQTVKALDVLKKFDYAKS